ncbi:TPA: transposase [Candidatus Sumerlaeota bacterium]|nr:transposase [Candidatus Sumerlaeota bacterium]
MSQTLVQNYLHLVFSTKRRELWFKDEIVLRRLHAYLVGACDHLECPTSQVGGVADHVHILCNLSKNIALKKLVQEVKIESSKWLKREFDGFSGFSWQERYGAFSISPSHFQPTKQYIMGQVEHHRLVPFQDELRRLLSLYGLSYDERYVWD